MKITYTIIVSTMALLFLALLVFYRSKKAPERRNVFECFIFAIFIMIANVGMTMSHYVGSSYFFHSLFFTSFDFFLLFYMVFCIRFTTKKTGIVPFLFLGLCLIDLGQFIANFFTKHIFTIQEITYKGEMFYSYTPSIFFSIHLGLCYLMILVGFIYLVIKIIKSPSIYMAPYIYVILVFIVVAIPDAIFLYSESPLNWAVVLFPFAAIGAYYIIFYFAPRRLQSKTMNFVTATMNNGLLILDINDNITYLNSFFTNYFDSDIKKELYILIEKWSEGKSLETFKDGFKNIEIEMKGEMKYFRLQFHKFLDKKSNYLGSFFIISDNTKEYKKIEEEHYRAVHDDLTDVYNREHFFEKAERIRLDNPDTKYTIVTNDIGNFKFINEMFGTASADFILKQFGSFLKKFAKPGSIYGRLDNDHFAIMLPSDRFDESLFLSVTNSIMKSLDRQMENFFNCYIGVYDLHEDIFVRSMVDRAILAIRTIKGTHNRVAYYTQEMSDQIIFEQELTYELQNAFTNDEIQIYIQPQVNRDGEILGGEALVRWIHPEKGVISPGVFIPVFEKSGIITDIDRIVWKKAALQVHKWEMEGLNYYLSVNVSPKDIFVLDIYKEFMDLINIYKINPKHLKIEITESAIMQNVAEAEKLILKLKSVGFIIEMDDFGSAYSSLNMLKDISVDVIKLDMAFLRKSEYTDRSKKIIESIVDMAEKLELGIVTEGVETKENLDFLLSIGCDTFQGYYFAKPMSVSDFEDKIKK